MKWHTADGDRYLRAGRKWVKIGKQPDGQYYLARGWEGDFKAAPLGMTKNIKRLRDAKSYGESWITD